MKIWTGKLKMYGPRKTEGPEVDAKIVIGDSTAIMFEVKDPDGRWHTEDPAGIQAESWLRALAETGKEVP